jgi:AcrR family transcriptional regulator
MKVKHSRATRAEGTRTALLRHARQVFAQKGFADASTDEMVQRAKVTKGALYHHFANKQDLYQAVIEEMEAELVNRLEAAAMATADRRDRLRAMCHAYLDACLDPNLARILVIEAPVILGWKTWCDIAQSNEVAALARCLSASKMAGFVSGEPLETIAQVLLGALNTGARVIATAPDPAAARAQVEETIERLLQGLASSSVSA